MSGTSANPTIPHFSHPERMLWPEEGITKQELGEYYAAVESLLMPHVEGRVLSLVRCPDGVGHPCFFTRHAIGGDSKGISLVDTGDDKPMMAVKGHDGLLELVQLNALEIHVWGSRIEDLERPDRLIFDLDPGEGVLWNEVKSAAVELRDRLDACGLRSFVKTSGGKGLHVTVPVDPIHDWDTAKSFTKAIAQKMSDDEPKRYVAAISKVRRKGRIFIDYLRNARSATAVAPYSTRARAGAPVAMPVSWSELDGLPGAAYYTLRTALSHIAKRPDDPWADIGRIRQTLKI